MSGLLSDGLPLVSVIVPVRNEGRRLRACLEALLAQTYPPDRTEILVVDNGSSDGTAHVVASFPVKLLSKDSAASPYVARNRALDSARGHVLAFTDADCVPEKEWLANAIDALSREDADLVAGQVRFSFSDPPRGAEIHDAISNLDNERSVAERGVAKTGNLIVARRVFTELGPFAPRRSGGDVEFTSRASGEGFSLVYEPGAVVVKPARRLFAMIRKQYRVGRGQVPLWRAGGMSRLAILRRSLRALLPGKPDALREPIRRRGPEGGEKWLLRVWLAGWLCGIAGSLGRLREISRTRARG